MTSSAFVLGSGPSFDLVVEHHTPIDDAVGEVDDAGLSFPSVGHVCESEVVGGHERDRVHSTEFLKDRRGSDSALLRIGAAQDLVQ